jgi:hypothetical protein
MKFRLIADQRGRVLVSPKAMRQLKELRRNLQELPGVFFDDRHQYSIRASRTKARVRRHKVARIDALPRKPSATSPGRRRSAYARDIAG